MVNLQVYRFENSFFFLFLKEIPLSWNQKRRQSNKPTGPPGEESDSSGSSAACLGPKWEAFGKLHFGKWEKSNVFFFLFKRFFFFFKVGFWFLDVFGWLLLVLESVVSTVFGQTSTFLGRSLYGSNLF